MSPPRTSRTLSVVVGLLLFLPLEASAQPTYSPGQILVKFRASAAKPTTNSLDDLTRRFGVQSIEPLFGQRPVLAKPAGDPAAIYRVRIRPDVDPQTASAAFSQHPNVLYAQPNHL
ncbi:MAG: hypothetical protein O2954_11600, partial [bacterium]|nr:hypothetical protein [bacterium]